MFYISKQKLFNYFFERSFFGLLVINFCKEKVRTVFECSDFLGSMINPVDRFL